MIDKSKRIDSNILDTEQKTAASPGVIGKTAARFGLALALSATLISSGGVAVAQDVCTQMQVYLTISPNHREDVMAYIAPRLKQKLNVDLVAEAVASNMMVDRIAAQGSSPRVTIAQWDSPIGLAACEKGQCAPIDTAKIPNLAGLPQWAISRDDKGDAVVLTAGVLSVGILYNEAELKKRGIAPPKSWSDLKRPEIQGRLGLTAPQSTLGTAGLAMLARINGGSEKNVEPGFAATKALLPKNTIFTWSSEVSNLFQLGDLWVAVSGSTIAPALRAKGTPIKFVVPAEGAPTVNTGLSFVKGAPCQAAAYEYTNLYFSNEFQALRLEHGTLTASKAAWKLLKPDVAAGLGMGPDDIDKFVDLDWKAINADRANWIERWTREIK